MTESNSAGSGVATALAHNSLIRSSSQRDSTGIEHSRPEESQELHIQVLRSIQYKPHERRKGYLRVAAQKSAKVLRREPKCTELLPKQIQMEGRFTTPRT